MENTDDLTSEKARQQEDARRLRELYTAYRSAGGKRQEDFAEDYGLKTQGNMGHYLHGRRPLNLRAAIGFAKGIGVPIAAFSPTIAAEIEEAAPLARSGSPQKPIPLTLQDLNGTEGQLIMFFRGLPAAEQEKVVTELNNAFNAHHPGASPANRQVNAPGPATKPPPASRSKREAFLPAAEGKVNKQKHKD